jgi:protein SCO1/2
MTRKRIIDLALLCLGLAGVLTVVGLQFKLNAVKQRIASGETVAGSPIGGPFTLTDQTGAPVTQQDLSGKYVLMYFGFTFCPAICPTELQKMARAMEEAGPLADKIQPVFITIDPARDTQSVMATYVPQFHPRLMGLTGTQEQIDAVLQSYRVYARKVTEPGMTEYTMDHSSYIYFIGPDGGLLGAYGISTPPSQITADLQKFIKS